MSSTTCPGHGQVIWHRRFCNGWWVSSIVTAQAGFPFSPTVASNRSQSAVGSAASDKVNVGTTTVAPGQTGPDGTINTTNETFVPYNSSTVITGNPNQWFNPLMFSLQSIVPCPNNSALTCGTLGDVSRGLLRGPGSDGMGLLPRERYGA